MKLILTKDFERVKNVYIDIIDNTPQIWKHARWVYGKHPSDESIQEYIDRGEMYFLMDGEEAAGVVVISMCQGEDYETVNWMEDLENDQVATLHLLAVCPAYSGRNLGFRILEEAMEITVKNGKKALRLDTLKTNLPAQKMYERAGFSCRGEQRLYVESTGTEDFVYYEKIPGATS